MNPSEQQTFIDERLAGRDLVCFAPGNWSLPLMPVHQIMMRLAPALKVLYVEPSPSDFRLREHISRGLPWHRSNFPIELRKNLYIYSLPIGLPFKRAIRLLNRVNQAYIARLVLKQVIHLRMIDPILWLTWPTQVDVLDKMNKAIVVYHVADELCEVPWGRRRVVTKMEDEILQRAELVITSSQPTYDARKNRARRILLVPNGVDFEHFSKGLGSETVPNDLAKIPKPIIGFSGAVDRRFDFLLFRKLAETYRYCSFVLIGPCHISLKKIANMPNVHYLGMKSVEEVPLYLTNFDVCLIPYLLNEYTRGLSPLKLLEYLSVGKPVVSTAIPACVEYEDVVYIARGHDEFLNFVEKALSENNRNLIDERIKKASQNTWQERVKTITRVLAEVLSSA